MSINPKHFAPFPFNYETIDNSDTFDSLQEFAARLRIIAESEIEEDLQDELNEIADSLEEIGDNHVGMDPLILMEEIVAMNSAMHVYDEERRKYMQEKYQSMSNIERTKIEKQLELTNEQKKYTWYYIATFPDIDKKAKLSSGYVLGNYDTKFIYNGNGTWTPEDMYDTNRSYF